MLAVKGQPKEKQLSGAAKPLSPSEAKDRVKGGVR
jgi:hypothetical protein